jgi:hypothetical protein
MGRRRSPESSFLARARSTVSPWPRPRRTRADQAPLTDFCNRREGRAHPGTTRYPARRRVLGAGVGHRRPRAAEHRLPGWESSSRSAGRPDPTRLRHEAREACSNRSGYPCRARTRSGSQERLSLAPCPEARLRPAARTVRPSNEPGYLHTARNRDSSPRPFADSNGAGANCVHFSRAQRGSPGRSTPPRARQRSRLGGSACDRSDLPAASERRFAKRVARELRGLWSDDLQSKASVVSANRPVAARGFFAAPSAAFDRHRSGALEDFTGRIAAGGQARHRLSMIFHLLRSVRTRAGPLATTPTERRSADRGPRPILSWGSRPACPSTDITQARPHPSASSCPETPSGRRHHPSSSRSALVVSHHPDGFLRAKARGFVAPRCRS